MKGNLYLYLSLLVSIILGLLIFNSNDDCPEKTNIDSLCLSSVIEKLTNDSVTEIDFGLEINCFKWDSLEIGSRGSYKDSPCLNFTLIDKGKYAENGKVVKGSNLESEMDWFDMDRHWQMIYFYHNGTIQNEALAISQSAVSFSDMTTNRGKIYLNKSESKFEISDRILGGISGTELIEHRQMIKKYANREDNPTK